MIISEPCSIWQKDLGGISYHCRKATRVILLVAMVHLVNCLVPDIIKTLQDSVELSSNMMVGK